MIHYQYYLVAFNPDPVRNEIINVGLIGLFEDKIFHRFLRGSDKIKFLAPNLSPTKHLGDGVVSLLEVIPPEFRAEEIPGLSTEFIQIYPAANGVAESYELFETNMSQLFDRLVKPLPMKRIATRSALHLKTTIKNQFTRKKLVGDSLENHKIVSNFQVAPASGLTADFAYKNGKLNIIEALDFRVKKESSSNKFKDAALSTVIISEARMKIDPAAKGKLIFIPPQKDAFDITPHKSMLHDFFDDVYNFNDRDEKQQFYIDIEKDVSIQTHI